MTRVFAVAVGVLAIAFGGATPTRAQDEEKKIVGTWEVSKSDELPAGSTIEFTKDGKVHVVVKEKTEPLKLEGTYTLEKTKLTVKLKLGEQTIDEVVTIKKLTATDLHLEDKDKKVDEFKKK
ncbi:MAG TPA: lipocalin family protein [Urbifossiella sp.]|jgi:uncharacterized protein (TIGR03066 family)|nr:lipocalin family protein [Urbifossiella sp.]